MAVKIRLSRGGAKKRPFYRIVIADVRAPRDGDFIEKVGTYNPMLPQESNTRITLKEDRVKHWLSVGAQPTDRVARLLGQAGVIEKPKYRPSPLKSVPGKKMQDRADEKVAKEEERKAAIEAAKNAPPAVEEPAAEQADDAAAE